MPASSGPGFRNTRSLAHDNPMLNHDESLLIFNHVCGAVRFIRALERPKPPERVEPATGDEIPF